MSALRSSRNAAARRDWCGRRHRQAVALERAVLGTGAVDEAAGLRRRRLARRQAPEIRLRHDALPVGFGRVLCRSRGSFAARRCSRAELMTESSPGSGVPASGAAVQPLLDAPAAAPRPPCRGPPTRRVLRGHGVGFGHLAEEGLHGAGGREDDQDPPRSSVMPRRVARGAARGQSLRAAGRAAPRRPRRRTRPRARRTTRPAPDAGASVDHRGHGRCFRAPGARSDRLEGDGADAEAVALARPILAGPHDAGRRMAVHGSGSSRLPDWSGVSLMPPSSSVEVHPDGPRKRPPANLQRFRPAAPAGRPSAKPAGLLDSPCQAVVAEFGAELGEAGPHAAPLEVGDVLVHGHVQP